MHALVDLLSGQIATAVSIAAALGFAVAAFLMLKSVRDFGHTGPRIRKEIADHYAGYAIWCVLRLGGWSMLIITFLGCVGAVVYAFILIVLEAEYVWYGYLISSVLSIAILTFLQLCRHLLYLPSVIVSSSQYRISRFYPLWKRLSPRRLKLAQTTLGLLMVALFVAAAWKLGAQGKTAELMILVGAVLAIAGVVALSTMTLEPRPRTTGHRTPPKLPNILMIGSDSLRADRLGVAGYHRTITPNIDALAKRGTAFLNCFVPLARTAPSLASLLTGTWPHTHGIRDNYIADEQARLPVSALPRILRTAGYATRAVADWAGSDLGKLDFGFDHVDAPEDQWNLKYLLRQGPKDIRFFLSLFCHNRFGKQFLPELFYLAGVPLTKELGYSARKAIASLSASGRPIFLNLFTASTHAPFGSPYPYYQAFTDAAYEGESKFSMVKMSDPEEIIESQKRPKADFDFDQITNLYDGCVRSFDNEVGNILSYLRECGLEDNTIVVVYSDHGLDLFEKESWGQGNTVLSNDASAHVPLVIVDPRKAGGRIVTQTVRSIDLAPTLLDLIGQETSEIIDGQSLSPHLDGERNISELAAFHETGLWLTPLPCMPREHIAYPGILELLDIRDKKTGTLSIRPEFESIVIEAKDRMVRDAQWKLTYQAFESGSVFKLFDLDNDPSCEHDLFSRHQEVARRLRTQLIEWILADPIMRLENERLVARSRFSGSSPQTTSEAHSKAAADATSVNAGVISAKR